MNIKFDLWFMTPRGKTVVNRQKLQDIFNQFKETSPENITYCLILPDK